MSSSKTGVLFVVVPRVLGLAIWSPEINAQGITRRGIRFCELLAQKYALSVFDLFMPGSMALLLVFFSFEVVVHAELVKS